MIWPVLLVKVTQVGKELDPEREVAFVEASRFAREKELMFPDTSVLTGEDVQEAFLKCARTFRNKIRSGQPDPRGDGLRPSVPGTLPSAQLPQPRSARGRGSPQPCGC
ncbi:hypothetical protein GH733_019407 [Mirounga leonina]|nr:hypothetical protein GH733_019407 [Mirounga leonina]